MDNGPRKRSQQLTKSGPNYQELPLKDLEAISIERKDGRAASETKSLIADLSKWGFLLSVFI